MGKMRMKIILAVVVHYGDYNITREAIESIRNGEIEPDIAVVCKEEDLLFFESCDVITIVDNKNKSYASRLNIAIEYAIDRKYKYLVLANNDIIVGFNTISSMFRFLSNHDSGFIAAPLILKEDRRVESAGIRINLFTGRHYHYYNGKKVEDIVLKLSPAPVPEEVLDLAKSCDPLNGLLLNTEIFPDAVAGTFMMIKTESIIDICFDEDIDYYFEDVLFCLKAGKKGVKSVVLPYCCIIHRGSQGTKMFETRRIASMVTANHMKVIRRFSPLKNTFLEVIPLASVVGLNLLYFSLKEKKPVDAILGVADGAFRELLGRKD